jgi:hypothetical protein
MSSIIRRGNTYHGISVEGRGVFTNDERDGTYAGQCKDGYACGLGVTTWPNGDKGCAEHGPDGQCDGRCLERHVSGNTGYYLFERGGKEQEYALVQHSCCYYNILVCARDDPRLLALIAQVAPVEVRPAARAPPPAIVAHSHPSNRPMDPPARVAPQALATAAATEVHPHAARRRWWPCGITQPSIALQRTTTQGCVAWTVLA